MAPLLFRESFIGQGIYYLSGKKLLQYDEEKPGFVIPEKYLLQSNQSKSSSRDPSLKPSLSDNNKDVEKGDKESEAAERTFKVEDADTNIETKESIRSENEPIITDWYGPDDPENPQNWTVTQKIFILMLLSILTSSVYMGSAIYTPGIEQLMEDFDISITLAILPLSMFVVGYGIGPMILSPLSEHPVLGRNRIYVITLILFVILQIPTALAKNIASLSVLRLLAGFFASPALATGGATIGDILPFHKLYIGIAVWAMSGVMGPALGPLLGGIFAQLLNWRWTIWFLMILSGTSCAILCFFLPETAAQNILYRRSLRLQRLTGNMNITTSHMIANASKTRNQVLVETLWRPIEITISEPIVFFFNCYIALIYACLYLWFESFPIVFQQIHGFNLIEMGCSYLGLVVGCSISLGPYLLITRHQLNKTFVHGQEFHPEVLMPTAIVGSFFLPIGIFIFAWTATADIHFIVPIIGSGVFVVGAFMVFQSVFNYLGGSFPRYLASVFAGNALFRSWFAAGFPLFAHRMYEVTGTEKFPVGWGSSIVGFATLAMIAIPVTIYHYGKQLRARSKYSN